MSTKNYISDEIIASLIDGDLTTKTSAEILDSIADSKELTELFCIASQAAMLVEEEHKQCSIDLTLSAGAGRYAAHTPSYGDKCCILSEMYALQKLGINVIDEDIVELATSNKWYIPSLGTPVEAIGKIAQYFGREIEITFKMNIDFLAEKLNQSYAIITYIDGGELFGDKEAEAIEDAMIGKIADHVVVVEGIDYKNNKVALYDPAIGEGLTNYDIKEFCMAWDDSNNMTIVIK